mmetsp:Transcript_73640/g.204713  ORF Transcript_73640/g.204713 Transcript_73640/m.204713 type:complete len:232 (-) Transcript_73640:2019-2714(-)
MCSRRRGFGWAAPQQIRNRGKVVREDTGGPVPFNVERHGARPGDDPAENPQRAAESTWQFSAIVGVEFATFARVVTQIASGWVFGLRESHVLWCAPAARWPVGGPYAQAADEEGERRSFAANGPDAAAAPATKGRRFILGHLVERSRPQRGTAGPGRRLLARCSRLERQGGQCRDAVHPRRRRVGVAGRSGPKSQDCRIERSLHDALRVPRQGPRKVPLPGGGLQVYRLGL